MSLLDDARQTYRDYVTDGVPASGAHNPVKSDIRDLWATAVALIDALREATAAGTVVYDTLTELNADLAHAAGTMAWVTADADPDNIGIYQKSGASGAGSWAYQAAFSFQSSIDAAAAAAVSDIEDEGDAQVARVAAAALGDVYLTNAEALSNGVVGVTSLVGGSGGTNGTFDAAFSGGAGSGAAARFTVAGGAVVSVIITSEGKNYTSAPTISFAASTGLTGASATVVIGQNEPASKVFGVIAGTTEDSLIINENVAGSATERARVPNSEFVKATARAASKERAFRLRLLSETALPAALILMHLGQSNNEPRNETGVSGGVSTGTITGITNSNVYMPTGGNGRNRFDFNATNAEWAVDWNEVSSFVTHQEGDSMESPGGGAGAMFSDFGPFRRMYQCSAAIGSRDFPVLGQGGPLANAHGLLRRMCAAARAAGYRPVVAYTLAEGEAAMAAGVSESTFYTNGMDYLGLMQLWAAQQMGRPDYRAPIVMAFPMQMYNSNSIDIIRALGRIMGDTPNALSIGGIYPYQGANDRVHNTNTGAAQRGEAYMLRLRRFFEDGDIAPPMMATDVTWNGTTTCVVRFAHPVTIDSPAFDFGSNLNASNALYGMEWVDNGSYVKINSAVAAGNKITLTLNATPAGTVGQQKFRIAVPTTTIAVVAGSTNRAGSVVRKSGSGVASLIDSTFTHYEFAVPQELTARAA